MATRGRPRIHFASGHLEVHEGQMTILLSSPGGETGQDIQRRARAVQKRAQYAAPYRTGELRHSISVNTTSPHEGAAADISANAPHAIIIEFGRKKVEATNKSWLHWTGDFSDVFTKSSRAVAGIHYMERALDAAV
jgi:hypothetical protein